MAYWTLSQTMDIRNHLLGMLYDGEVFLGQHPVTVLVLLQRRNAVQQITHST
jgi:hypothetical protein